MIIRDFGLVANSDARVTFATVAWEDCDYPEQELVFETRGDGLDHAAGEPCADAFLSACFPLAAMHGESRDAMGRAARMATSSLHLTDGVPDAPAERLEQVPRRPGPG